MSPRVWNRRDPKVPSDAVYVGRPTKWGNPFRFSGGMEARRECIASFTRETLPSLDVRELRGKDLVCWCAPLPCHADVLLEGANRVVEHDSPSEGRVEET